MDEFSFKEMKTWGQFKFISYCICLVWIRRTRRQEFKIPLCNSSGGNLLRQLPNINDGGPLRKQPTSQTSWLFPQKNSTTDVRSDFKCRSDQRFCKSGMWVKCKCMEFVTVSWWRRKWLRLYQTKRNLASGDMGIPLVVIRLGVQALVSPRPVWEKRGEGTVI